MGCGARPGGARPGFSRWMYWSISSRHTAPCFGAFVPRRAGLPFGPGTVAVRLDHRFATTSPQNQHTVLLGLLRHGAGDLAPALMAPAIASLQQIQATPRCQVSLDACAITGCVQECEHKIGSNVLSSTQCVVHVQPGTHCGPQTPSIRQSPCSSTCAQGCPTTAPGPGLRVAATAGRASGDTAIGLRNDGNGRASGGRAGLH